MSETATVFQRQRKMRTSIPLTASAVAPLLAACGGGGGGSTTTLNPYGSYEAPSSSYTPPGAPDALAFTLQQTLVDPYWVQSLRNGDADTISAVVSASSREFVYVFPDAQPDYYTEPENTAGWQPASAAVQAAYREIFAYFERIVNVDFREGTSLDGNNVIAVSQTNQADNVLGFAYYPNLTSLLGSDILISNNYDNPTKTGSSTNIDYETLVHELGHALGLKHPFETETGSTVTLNAAEDNSTWTVMTYTLKPGDYDGEFRAFDLMALTELYGVNPSYSAGDDTYLFKSGSGTFVVDGGGYDTINASSLSQAVTIDLRPGGHSFVGSKSVRISDGNQLTISSGSEIEAALGGSGNDTLLGNDLGNLLRGGAGADRLFGSEGGDTFDGGGGLDTLDLSEVAAKSDTVTFATGSGTSSTDTVYSFTQGAGGDIISVSGLSFENLLDVVAATSVPTATVSGVILRLVGTGLETAAGISSALSGGGAFDAIDIAVGGRALILSAGSQSTGQDQCLFHASNTGGTLSVDFLATFQGNYLDIDSWAAANFA